MKFRVLLVVSGLLISQVTLAGVGPPPPPPPPPPAGGAVVLPSDTTRTRFYAGLQWDLPGPLAPSLVLALRRIKEQADGDKRGFDLSYSFALFNGFKPGKLRLKAFSGGEDFQGELGGGYDFGAGGFFVGPSVNGPHVAAGVDWLLGAGLQPYGMISTLSK